MLEWDEELPRQQAAWRSSQAEAEAASAREATEAALERRRMCARFNLQVFRAVTSHCKQEVSRCMGHWRCRGQRVRSTNEQNRVEMYITAGSARG